MTVLVGQASFCHQQHWLPVPWITEDDRTLSLKALLLSSPFESWENWSTWCHVTWACMLVHSSLRAWNMGTVHCQWKAELEDRSVRICTKTGGDAQGYIIGKYKITFVNQNLAHYFKKRWARECQRASEYEQGGREQQTPCWAEAHTGLRIRTLGSWPELKADTSHWAIQAPRA